MGADVQSVTKRELVNLISPIVSKPDHDRSYRERVLLRLYMANTWVDAIDLARTGGLGYRSRITDLRHQGYTIECRLKPNRPKGKVRYQFQLVIK